MGFTLDVVPTCPACHCLQELIMYIGNLDTVVCRYSVGQPCEHWPTGGGVEGEGEDCPPAETPPPKLQEGGG